MSTSSQEKVWLSLSAQDMAAEIAVVDGQLRVVAEGLGSLDKQLPPGIYKARATAGTQSWEDLVVLPAGKNRVHIQIPLIEFATPVPLPQTAQHHEYHESAAFRESGQVHFAAGQGSRVFMFVRRYTPPDMSATVSPSFHHPARGLTLRDGKGDLVADVMAHAAVESSPHQDPWAACNVLVDPGLYRLRLDLPGGGVLEQTIVASPGWQTQIFALQRRYGSEPDDERADLLGASILYARYDPEFGRTVGFAPMLPEYRESARLVELARLGLTDRRVVLRRDIIDMLWAKWENPMLGLLGGHLLLLDKAPDLDLLHTVVGNLRGMLGKHPDVEALALALTPGEQPYVFETPPMLRRSWSLVLGATITKPDLVPLNSLASRIAEHLWGEGPWLLWSSPAELDAVVAEGMAASTSPIKKKESLAPSEYEAALSSQLQLIQQSRQETPRTLSDLETKPQLNDATVTRLVQTLGIPRANIEKMVDGLWQRARLYESIREDLPAGRTRTITMENVVRQIKEIAAEGKEYVSALMRDFSAKPSAGSRLIALALLENQPDSQLFPFVRSVIGQSLSAFEQYHALLAALAMLPQLTPEQQQQLRAVIEDQRTIGEGKYIKTGTDRWQVSTILLGRLK